MELMEVLEGCFLFGRSRLTSVFYGNALATVSATKLGNRDFVSNIESLRK